ncbi:TELO2-interacting protein 2 isoform X2 [Syngnathoides biaculeatus]|uniref:TELO2-interacting protein 2 isoform X2 n=1 Tax=Syngnathoides biaculeatus TaxID=300417 RepID=UPI002ADE01F2|nr:TELO2-interacting protein 2 isoform X2 [Syngnathoides biaculeatus]
MRQKLSVSPLLWNPRFVGSGCREETFHRRTRPKRKCPSRRARSLFSSFSLGDDFRNVLLKVDLTVVAAPQTTMSEFSQLLDELDGDAADDPPPSSAATLLAKLRRRLIDGPPDPSRLVDALAAFLRAADPRWLFEPADGAAALEAAYASAVGALTALPPSEPARGGPPAADVHAHVPDAAARVCAALRGLLGKAEAAGPDGGARGVLMAVAPHVCVYVATHAQDQPWTSRASREAARRLGTALLAAGGWRDAAHMLTGERDAVGGGLLEAVLDVLRPGLSGEASQRDDRAEAAFAWTLFQVPRPCLAPHLPRLLGPALLLSDHHEPRKCMLGLRCLHHIVDNTASSELRALKRADVMYDALLRLAYGAKSADVMQLVLRCLLDLLAVLESPTSSVPAPRRARRHDDVLRLILTRMEAEHEAALRRVYAGALPAYLERMGAHACRHLRRLGRVVPAYLEVSDAPEEVARICALRALERILEAAWPRLAASVSVWLPSLLRLLADATSEPRPRRDAAHELRRRAARCAALLVAAAGGERLRVDVKSFTADVTSYVATVTTATES